MPWISIGLQCWTDWVVTNVQGWKDMRGNYSDKSLCFKCTKRSTSVTLLCTDITGLGTMEHCVAVIQSSNTDSEWSQKNDVTAAACSNNKEVPFRMGRSEARLKPEGNSAFEKPPNNTHRHWLHGTVGWISHKMWTVTWVKGALHKHFKESAFQIWIPLNLSSSFI